MEYIMIGILKVQTNILQHYRLNDEERLVYRIITAIVICLYILSEYVPALQKIDNLHLKHYFLIGWTLFLFFNCLSKGIKIDKDIISILACTGILFFISIIKQVYYGKFKFYSLEEIYYLILPFLFVYIIYIINGTRDFDFFMHCIFWCSVLAFLLRFYDQLTIQNLLSQFNIVNTIVTSLTVFESDLGLFFTFCFFYFIVYKRYVLTFISILFIILCAKRINIIFMILTCFLYIIFRKRTLTKKINNLTFCIAILFFTVIPIILYVVYSNGTIISWFFEKTGLDFNQFSMARFQIFELLSKTNSEIDGLGAVTSILETLNLPGQTNLHNDLMRLYLECGVIGLFSFIFFYLQFAKTNWYSFYFMIFILLELLVAHFLGAGSTSFWIIAYICLFQFKRIKSTTNMNGK